jgi:hypothetical protein
VIPKPGLSACLFCEVPRRHPVKSLWLEAVTSVFCGLTYFLTISAVVKVPGRYRNGWRQWGWGQRSWDRAIWEKRKSEFRIEEN